MYAYESLSGNTPLVRIFYRLDGRAGSVWAKLESFNLSGSIKDRVAAFVLARAQASGALRPGQPIVEVSSGNTGIAFAALGALTGHPTHIFLPDHLSRERRQLLEMYGARLHLVRADQGGFQGALALARAAAAELGAFTPRQFDNQENPLAHQRTTGAELLAALPGVRTFAAGVGTGGTLMGVARALGPKACIAAVEPAAAALLSGGAAGPHRIEGIGDDFIPSILDRGRIHRVVDVVDEDAIWLSARLARELGLGVGISSGANLYAALLLDAEGKGPVATVFADDNKKYLSTTLAAPARPADGSLAARVELLGWRRADAPALFGAARAVCPLVKHCPCVVY